VLEPAKRAAVIDADEATVIGATRLEDVPLAEVAAQLGVSVQLASSWRRKSARRLIEAIREGELSEVGIGATFHRNLDMEARLNGLSRAPRGRDAICGETPKRHTAVSRRLDQRVCCQAQQNVRRSGRSRRSATSVDAGGHAASRCPLLEAVMARETREVLVCDVCGSDKDVAVVAVTMNGAQQSAELCAEHRKAVREALARVLPALTPAPPQRPTKRAGASGRKAPTPAADKIVEGQRASKRTATCPHCGREMSVQNLGRHIASSHPGAE
jgi:transcription elongation factor Elf1